MENRFLITKEIRTSKNYDLYYGIDLRNGKEVTIKGVNFSAEKSIYSKEAYNVIKSLIKHKGSNIISSYEFKNKFYIVFERIYGETLGQYIKTKGAIRLDQILELIIPLLDILETIHAQNFIYSNLCPNEILITKNCKIKLLSLMDNIIEIKKYRQLGWLIRDGYSAPELYSSKGDIGAWTDIYAVGALMYFAINGKKPKNVLERLIIDDIVYSTSFLNVNKVLKKALELKNKKEIPIN